MLRQRQQAAPQQISLRVESTHVTIQMGGVALGVVLQPHGGSKPTFVPATKIGWCGLFGRVLGRAGGGNSWLRITLDKRHVRALGYDGLQLTTAAVVRQRDPLRLLLWHRNVRSLIAWAFNSMLLLGSTAWLLFTLLSQHLLPSQLEAQPLAMAEWYAAFERALCVALLMSFLVFDGVKIVLLTMLNQPCIETRLRGNPCLRLVRKALRRVHNVLDILF